MMIRNALTALATLAALPLSTLPSAAEVDSYPEAEAIVSIGGPVTEIVYALGEENRLIARDTTSVFPEAAEELPDVGYMRQLSAGRRALGGTRSDPDP